MNKWRKRIAVIAGGSSRNGLGTWKKFAKAGITVSWFDLKIDEIQRFQKKNSDFKIHPLICDVTDDNEIKSAFKWIENQLKVARFTVWIFAKCVSVDIFHNFSFLALFWDLCCMFNKASLYSARNLRKLKTSW